MADYDIFARFYDAVMGDRSDVITLLQDQISNYLPHCRTVLELGCGTGELLAGLNPDYALSGIDQSANMLEVAQQKLPQASFYQTTIAGFELGQTYDLVYCLFDTVNHLTSFDDWLKLLNSTAAHLADGGLFVFDMNTTGRLQVLTRVPSYLQEFDGNVMHMQVSAAGPDEVEWHVSVEEPQPDGLIAVYEEFVHEASFPLARVRRALGDTGFEILAEFDSSSGKTSDNSDRVYFVCRKKYDKSGKN